MRALAFVFLLAVLAVSTLLGIRSCTEKVKPAISDTAKAPRVVLERAEQRSAEYALSQLRTAVGAFQAQQGRFPAGLDELVSSGLLRQLPPGDFRYDASTGEVSQP